MCDEWLGLMGRLGRVRQRRMDGNGLEDGDVRMGAWNDETWTMLELMGDSSDQQ